MLAENLNKFIKERSLSLSEVARLAKVPKSTIHAWSTGQKTVNLDQLGRVARVLGVSISTLAYGEREVAAEVPTEVLKDLFSGDVRVTVQRIVRNPPTKK